MPGATRARFRWKDKKPPLYWSILAVIFVFTFFLWIGFDFIIPHIGVTISDSHHSRAISIYGGTYFLQPWAAWFHESGGWIPGSFFVALLLIEFVKGEYLPRAR